MTADSMTADGERGAPQPPAPTTKLKDALIEQLTADKAALERTLRHRDKELGCLYGLTTLIERHSPDLGAVLHGLARLLPAASEQPEASCARVLLDGREYRSSRYGPARKRKIASILVGGSRRGTIELRRVSRKPAAALAPFCRHEALLLDAVAERVGRVVERVEAQQLVELERVSLDRSNTALREVLARVQDEKMEIGRAVDENVAKVVMPLIYDVERELRPRRSKHLELLKRHLAELTSTFARELSREFHSLSPTEVQVCRLVQNDLTSKEIAELRGVSVATVNRQRDAIRRKLGLTNQDVNLVTFLQSYAGRLAEGRSQP